MIDRFRPEGYVRICAALLIGVVLACSFLALVNEQSQFLQMPTLRYFHAVNPFLASADPLIDSISEHSITSIKESFFFHSILMIFAGLGAWMMLGRQERVRQILPEMAAFALILGIAGAYVGSTFVRLEVLTSVSLIVLASVGISVLVRAVRDNKSLVPSGIAGRVARGSFFAMLALLLLVPVMLPDKANWLVLTAIPPTILNGGTLYPVHTSDWHDTLEWMGENTPEGSVVAAWWDYGYWISTVSNRATIADNSTIDSGQIARIASMFVSTPDEGWRMLQEMDADYVVVFVAGERLDVMSEQPLYLLRGGGDESKKQWIVRIAGQPLERYVRIDGDTPTDYFWNETLLGRLFPFSTLGYVHFESNLQTLNYMPGLTAMYVRDVKYPQDGRDAPFRMVYASPSYHDEDPGPKLGVFVYEINHEYVPAGSAQ